MTTLASAVFSGQESEALEPKWATHRRYSRTAYGQIAYIDRGRGPAALFLHGFPLNAYQWRGAIARLQSIRRCIAPDFLGLGLTQPRADVSLNPASQAAMLLSFLDTLHIDSVDVVANDSGSAIAQLLVANSPDRVRSLLLTNGDTEPDCPPPALRPLIQLAKAGRYTNEWLVPLARAPERARTEKDIGGCCYSKPEQPSDAAIAQYVRPVVATKRRRDLVDRYLAALESNSLAGVTPRLNKFSGSVRIVWGTGDTIFRPDSPDYLMRTFAHVESLRRIPGAKLFFPEEYPHIIAEEARRMWSG